MTKHTPGPWAVNPVLAQVDAFVEGKPLPVCQMLWPTERRTEAETQANARLIAAAPEMLEALISLNAALAAQAVGAPLSAELVEQYQREADAALARATRQP